MIYSLLEQWKQGKERETDAGKYSLIISVGWKRNSTAFTVSRKCCLQQNVFKSLSCEAKVLYGLMLDRMSLSIKNRWFDEEDRVYIIFTVGRNSRTSELRDTESGKADERTGQ